MSETGGTGGPGSMSGRHGMGGPGMGMADTYVERLRSTIEALETMARQSERELAESQDQRAEAARDGRLGRDWQDVQRRIDDGHTTLADVFSGRDGSPAARRLLDTSQQNIARMAEQLDAPAEVEEELAAAEQQWDRLRGRSSR